MYNDRSFESHVANIFGKRAATYDRLIGLYSAVGFREWVYRRRAVETLGLKPGDMVVEIGCGTGRNFAALQRAIGPEGRLIGVDMTEAMLDQARQRVKVAGWRNVELIMSEAVEYEFPDRVDGIISTYVLSYCPRCDEVIRNGSRALAPGGRLVVMDMKEPPKPLGRMMVSIAVSILSPYAVTRDYFVKNPQKILRALYRNLDDTRIDEWYLGLVYVASGTRQEA